ncbi:MAG: glycosyl hydrolase [Acidobacteria bacterium]|nr:glycosyl hydrolase [Acidobacteriota bacterium]
MIGKRASGGLIVLAALSLTTPAASADSGVRITPNTFGAIRARAIGPAIMSGRVAAVAAVPGNQLTLWVGAASGGVWKSVNGGLTFKPVFDEHTQSIGALAIDPRNPKIVWVGTGESWVRNSVSVGDGVYRTNDGGETWEHVGLEDTEHIARIVASPVDSDTAWVCATGHLWNSNEQRGVFKTTDGGKTWKKVLYVDENTGCSDLAADPQEPGILYAGMWQFRRSPSFFTSGGPGSGLYRSTDGGETWKRLTDGLPKGELGRIAVAVAPSRPSTVYAVVESKDTALYRSDDLGERWEKRSTSAIVQDRPFYFAGLAVDPNDFNTVYKASWSLGVSEDGGRTFTGTGGSVHSDVHAIWIDPTDSHRIFIGTDGGAYLSTDRGNRWLHMRNLPISQPYHVSVDNAVPYRVYTGLQDNGSWMAPSRADGGIGPCDWKMVGFGDGFWAFADPSDGNVIYAEYQGGNILRVARDTGEAKEIKPYAREGETKLRFNWNTPVAFSPNHPGTLYIGAQYLFRSRDRGDSWERISPDLTTNDPARQRQEEAGGLTIDNSTAENNTTIFTISESPLDDQLIWAGTDDGNLQLTEDGGIHWRNVAPNVPGLDGRTWVSSVQASIHDRKTAYVSFDGHRHGDMAPHVYRTTDLGATWEPLAPNGLEGYVHVIKEDPKRSSLLFAGTEHGLYISLDGGAHWVRFKGNLPPVPVRDMTIQEREGDLVLATHGRGIYIIDDLTPIRALTPETIDSPVALLPARPAEMPIAGVSWPFTGDDEFVGDNPREEAVITYWLKRRHLFGDLKVEIYGQDGTLITTIPGSKRVGINRVAWSMRLPPPKVPPATSLVPAMRGPRILEGTYKVKLIKGKRNVEGTVKLVADPRSPHSAEDRAVQQKTALDLYHDLGRLTYLIDAISDARDQAAARSGTARPKRLRRRLNTARDHLENLRRELVATKKGAITGEEKLREKLGELYGAVNRYDGRPTKSQLQRKTILEGQLETAERRFETFAGGELSALSASLKKAGLEPITVLSQETWNKRQEARGGGGAEPLASPGALPLVVF